MNLTDRIHQTLPQDVVQLLHEAGTVAAQERMPLYLVGGSVRDLLLERPLLDLDLVVEGDAAVLAHELAKHLAGVVTAYSPFGTAKVKAGSRTVDLATARWEIYAQPGALPTVRPGTLRDDLLRRDFSVNALAVHLASEHFGELLDLAGGLADLQKGLVRVLHSDSFRDDATRILRAVRYEQRLNFRLDEETERLLRRDLSCLDTISPDRLRHEVERILAEETPAKPLLRASELGVLAAVHPSLRAVARWRAVFQAVHTSGKASPLLYLALLAYTIQLKQAEGLIQRLNLTARQAHIVRDMQRIKELTRTLARPGMQPSQVYHLLRELAPEALDAGVLAIENAATRDRLRRYIDEWRHVRPALSGRDLLRLGVPQGPRVGELLDELKRGRLDGQISSREQEEALVQRRIIEG